MRQNFTLQPGKLMSTFDERYQQAQLYAAQLRVRKAMGDQYAHTPTNHQRKLPCLSGYHPQGLDHDSAP
jgi:hypothetical protein